MSTAFARYVLDTPRSGWSANKVYGLGDPVEHARILDKPLGQWQNAQDGTGKRVDGPAMVIGRDLWASEALVARFTDAAQQRDGTTVLRFVRPDDADASVVDPLHRLERINAQIAFDLWWIPAGMSADLDALPSQAVEGLEVPSRVRHMRLPADPEITGEEVLKLAMTAAVAAPVGHFVEVQRANLLAMGAVSLATPRWLRVAHFFLAAFRVRSFSPEKRLAGMNRLGAGCVIHPTAVVEASRLGDFVEVGPHAVVRGCHLAKDVLIGPHAIAELSVIGEGARLQRRATVAASVVYPRARLGGFFQMGVAGEGAVTKVDSVTTDMLSEGRVRVPTPDGLREVDIGYQGVCLGHRSWVGSGVWIAPGRVVEAEARLARDRSLFVT